MLSKKDFIRFASVISAFRAKQDNPRDRLVSAELTLALAEAFAETNSLFSREKFLSAALGPDWNPRVFPATYRNVV